MTVEASIYAALKSLVSNRVYRDVAPDNNQSYPYITFQQIGGEGINFLDPTVPSKKNARFQINCWGGPNRSPDRDTMTTLGRQVEDALRVTTSLHTHVEGALVSLYDERTKAFGTMQDFSLWHNA